MKLSLTFFQKLLQYLCCFQKIHTVKNPDIRLIDFTDAKCEDRENDNDIDTIGFIGEDITTLSYRAPEILLEIGWKYPIDMWSIG